MKKKISIVITNFNKAKYLEKCLDSCIKQNFKSFEVIIIDNFSTDNSIKIINSYKNVKLFKLKRKYLYPAQNQLASFLYAIKQCKGQIILLLDSDDYFSSNKLSIVDNFFKKNKKAMLAFDLPIYLYKNKLVKSSKYKNNFLINKIWPKTFPSSSISFRKSFIKYINKFIKVDRYNLLEIDFRLCLLSYLVEKKLNFIENNLTVYRQNTGGIMSNYKKFSLRWWVKRHQAFKYLKKMNKIFCLDYSISIQAVITSVMAFFSSTLLSLFTKNKN